MNGGRVGNVWDCSGDAALAKEKRFSRGSGLRDLRASSLVDVVAKLCEPKLLYRDGRGAVNVPSIVASSLPF
jgi:hypothetical protein